MNKKVHYLGLDVHKETIAVAIAPAGDTEVRHYGTIAGTLDALDKLIKKLQQPGLELRLVYEAGPCGYVIYRHLKKKGLHCEVVAPSLIPKKASDRVKTDRRDARSSVILLRLLLEANYDIRTVQELLGHSRVDTTMRPTANWFR